MAEFSKVYFVFKMQQEVVGIGRGRYYYGTHVSEKQYVIWKNLNITVCNMADWPFSNMEH